MAWILSLKIFIISAAVLFTALGLKASLPFATIHLPLIWNLFLLCFKPPYLYFIVNAIIISIVASSRFYHSAASNDSAESTPPPVPAYEMKSPPEFNISKAPVVFEPSTEDPPVLEVKAVVVNGVAAVEDEEDEKVIDEGMEESTWTSLKRMDSTTEIPPEYISPTEKPLVSARFGHRKPLRSSPEGGRALRVAMPKRQETLENTWKAITEGRGMPLNRHMKKCDTWQDRVDTGPLEVKKSATFKDRTSQPPQPRVLASAGRLRKEPSLSQDELNRRVEAFIRKFNEQMRLQRQESLNQYTQMINRGEN